MAVDMRRDGRVGCAYFVAIDGALFLEEDVGMGGTELVETLILRVQPTTILIPNRAPQDLAQLLERHALGFSEDETEDSDQNRHFILRYLTSAEFDYEIGKEVLASVDLGSPIPNPVRVIGPEDDSADYIGSSRHHRLMRLAGIINLESHLSVGCAGAVLSDLERRIMIENEGPNAEAFQAKSMAMNTPADTMLVSADTLTSLQILLPEVHPNPRIQSSNRSQHKLNAGLSISGLFQSLASTVMGKSRIRQMLLQPSTNIELITERQRVIAVLLLDQNAELASSMRKLLRKIKHPKTMLRYIRGRVDRNRGQLSPRLGDWMALLRFSMASTQLKEAVSSLSRTDEAPLFSKICEGIDSQAFEAIGNLIVHTLDFKLSGENGHTEINKGVSTTLDKLEQKLATVVQLLPALQQAASSYIPRWAVQHIQHCTIMSQLGFLLAVTRNPETGQGVYNGKELADDNWEIVFATKDVVYYKTRVMLAFDERYGNVHTDIANEEIKVVLQLSGCIKEFEGTIYQAAALFRELDSLLALASAAERYNWAAPLMTPSNIINIVDGRHPLQELIVPSFIPNDCSIIVGRGSGDPEEGDLIMGDAMEDQETPMIILTSPNNSGKSVYMRQVAIIVYLAHIGSYVPATRATIGVTDRILTRIATRETALLLIDEFGRGTTTDAGSALFGAYLTRFLSLDVERPKVLVGTHLHDIFHCGIIRPEDGVAFVHMDFGHDPEREDPEDQDDVIDRAEQLVRGQNRDEDPEEMCTVRTAEEEEALMEAEKMARRLMTLQVPRRGSANVRSIRDMLREAMYPNSVEVSDASSHSDSYMDLDPGLDLNLDLDSHLDFNSDMDSS
ncbi:DNA mismatch repair protein MutS [Podospora didyma]|uniref:DNA mismatch repair protein MutS n=1 Tax=Podospora didyma TaxID=330526 RepID=A0AAE0U857_9PEZI|nr:DNA mismatch repair protein MutS [Podospora didyma]